MPVSDTIGHVSALGPDWLEVESPETLHNGDAISWFDLHKVLHGCKVNVAQRQRGPVWRLFPNESLSTLQGLRKGVDIHRNRDMAWDRLLAKKSSDRRIGVWLNLSETPEGFALAVTDEAGHQGHASVQMAHQAPHHSPTPTEGTDVASAKAAITAKLTRLGDTIFEALDVQVQWSQAWFVPASTLNDLRRQAIAQLELARAQAYQRPTPATAVEPPVPYPDDALTYLANVYNDKARQFYAKHGVTVIEPAYESHQELGEVSLMITKHCVRYSLSLCPKQAKGVIGVKGTIKADPLVLVNGKEKLTLRFDCKPCEMHVVGKMKPGVLQQRKQEMLVAEKAEAPLRFYRTRP